MPAKRILIVDDEDHIREVASMSLELTKGWQVISASSGAAAMRAAVAQTPDVILLDVMMPEMDGPSTLRHLKADERTCRIPVIFLTAKVQTAEKRKFAQFGADGVISKPFDPLTLADTIEQTLQWT